MTPVGHMQGSSGDNEKRTPRALFDWANRRYRFTYDAMASHESALCATYSTPDGTFRSTGWGSEQIDALDGLRQEWFNRRVWTNPPYGRGVFKAAVEKMLAERDNAEIIVGLVKWDTSTVLARLLRLNAEIIELPRITYEGEPHPASFTSALVIIRPSLATIPTK